MSFQAIYTYFSTPRSQLSPSTCLNSSPTSSPPSSPSTMALDLRMPSPLPPNRAATRTPPARPRTASPPTEYGSVSKSERLLYDTLRRDEERLSLSRSPSRRRPVRDPDEPDEALWLASSSKAVNILRRQSQSSSCAPAPLFSPLPARMGSGSPPAPPLHRIHTSPVAMGRHRHTLSASSAPTPRPSTPKERTSGLSYERATPEAALRARLENTLSSSPTAGSANGAGGVASPAFQSASSDPVVPRRRHERSQSMAHSQASQNDWPWGPSLESSGESSHTPSSTPHEASPITPPCTFNVRTASQICKQMPGYVSFQDVEGLSEPPAEPEDADADEPLSSKDRRWWLWPWGGRSRDLTR